MREIFAYTLALLVGGVSFALALALYDLLFSAATARGMFSPALFLMFFLGFLFMIGYLFVAVSGRRAL